MFATRVVINDQGHNKRKYFTKERKGKRHQTHMGRSMLSGKEKKNGSCEDKKKRREEDQKEIPSLQPVQDAVVPASTELVESEKEDDTSQRHPSHDRIMEETPNQVLQGDEV